MHFYLARFQRIHPVCISLFAPIINATEFPFPASDSYGYKPSITKRSALARACRWLDQRVPRVLRTNRNMSQNERLNWATQVIKDRKALLIHAHYGPVGWWMLRAKRILRIPVVTTFYGYDTAPMVAEEGVDWPRRRQQLFDKGDLFLAEGAFMRKQLIALGCPPEKIQIQPIAIDFAKTQFQPRTMPASRRVVITFAGRFVEKKGLAYSLPAFHQLWQRHRNVEFRLIGDGDLTPWVSEYIRQNDLTACIQVLGFRSHHDYLEAMRDSDIFLHPSVTAHDGDTEGGAPTTILEAQALGMPVVSTYHADIPNITVPGESAILVQERDIAGLVGALSYLIEHPDVWASMGAAGRNFVERFHDIQSQVSQLEDKYFRLLQHGPASDR
jgi:colanic acid/amylovoran biosynthesis glycosyltransferase